ncbi:MAG TPA: hypothetical protein VED66_17520 [Candidatus Sulfotelmatobacter sp.]|nr:hypothetical protein [Candidatus Sulfotelmatobacter sp.]
MARLKCMSEKRRLELAVDYPAARSPLAAGMAKPIHRAMGNCSPEVLYTPWHWRYIMTALRLIPEWIFKRLAV